jgi:uncharacterized protein with HEPN domain
MPGAHHGAVFSTSRRDDAVERQLFIIGEAAAHLPDEWTSRRPEVPWRRIVGLRNILAHAYWRIDEDELWEIATNKVRPLAEAVAALLAETAPR